MAELELSDKIYRVCGQGLGDCIGGVMIYLNWGLEQQKRIRISTWYRRSNRIRNCKSKLNEIVSVIKEQKYVMLTDEEATSKYPRGNELKIRYFSTDPCWCKNSSKNITYQFDGKSHKEKNFPSKEDELHVINSIKEMGFNPIRLGFNLSLKKCVEQISNSQAFVGVPSGMAVLSWATKIPVFIITHGLDQTWLEQHKASHFVLAKDGKEFLDMFSKYNLPFYKSICINPEYIE